MLGTPDYGSRQYKRQTVNGENSLVEPGYHEKRWLQHKHSLNQKGTRNANYFIFIILLFFRQLPLLV